ncbi:MAG: hypothetical protein FD180_4316 [Planctomycetota bacterium]|nr:MAG: hypothetical protein FD180_4316 [Planctomycetota bacterium]
MNALRTVAVLLVLATAASAQEDRLRALEKDIAAARGLEFKEPVRAKTIDRPADATKHIQGYYSTDDKTLYLYSDISGAYEKGVLIHEMAHALQDQHFGLAKLHQSTFEGESELALAALIEGDATLTMIEVLKTEQPKAGAMLESPLEKARNLQSAFLYAQGARFVRALKEKGGWEAVNALFRNPPRTTAAILHPLGHVNPVRVRNGKSVGELGIIRMLAANPASAADAVKAAAGWKGDGETVLGAARLWEVAFETAADAEDFAEALALLRCAQEPTLVAVHAEKGLREWRGAGGSLLAIATRGERAYVVDRPDDADFSRLLGQARGESPELSVLSVKDGRAITWGEFTDRLLAADIICVGETHDSEAHHQVQLRVIKALFASDESLGVGMEMFQTPLQQTLDRYIAGSMTEEEFLKETDWAKSWGFEWSLYRPIVEFCRRNGVGLAALNAPKALTRKIGKGGWESLSEEDRIALGEVDLASPEHREHWLERIGAMHGDKKPSEDQLERTYQVMATWDSVMAASTARFQQERRLHRMVVVAGSGHAGYRFGIPARAAALTGGKAVIVRVDAGDGGGDIDGDADFVVKVR